MHGLRLSAFRSSCNARCEWSQGKGKTVGVALAPRLSARYLSQAALKELTELFAAMKQRHGGKETAEGREWMKEEVTRKLGSWKRRYQGAQASA